MLTLEWFQITGLWPKILCRLVLSPYFFRKDQKSLQLFFRIRSCLLRIITTDEQNLHGALRWFETAKDQSQLIHKSRLIHIREWKILQVAICKYYQMSGCTNQSSSGLSPTSSVWYKVNGEIMKWTNIWRFPLFLHRGDFTKISFKAMSHYALCSKIKSLTRRNIDTHQYSVLQHHHSFSLSHLWWLTNHKMGLHSYNLPLRFFYNFKYPFLRKG